MKRTIILATALAALISNAVADESHPDDIELMSDQGGVNMAVQTRKYKNDEVKMRYLAEADGVYYFFTYPDFCVYVTGSLDEQVKPLPSYCYMRHSKQKGKELVLGVLNEQNTTLSQVLARKGVFE